jgi:isopentenyl phosphate kinase
MNELVFLKLGGSLLTDKTRPRALRGDVLQRLAAEIAAALAETPGLRLVIGHGSGSFGHVTARQHGTRDGVRSPAEWRGYAEVARVAAELNHLVVDALWEAGVPALRIQPSASARCRDGELVALDERPLIIALRHGLAPVIHGDVALDDVRGGTIISTEEIFRWLAPRLLPQRVILVGEVAGVLTADPTSGVAGEVIPEITPALLPQFAAALGGSRGVDVTGGMVAKVAEMVTMAQSTPSLVCVQVVSGLTPGLVHEVLTDPALRAGTRIVAAPSPQNDHRGEPDSVSTA